jgi:integrase
VSGWGVVRAIFPARYETLARRGELVALEVRDIDFYPNGTGQAFIRRGTTDAEGQGRGEYLSRETVKWLKVWLLVDRVSAPSSRADAAQDLTALDIDLAAITHAETHRRHSGALRRPR